MNGIQGNVVVGLVEDDMDMLEPVEIGDYGWALYTDPSTFIVHRVWYDDDEYACVCGNDECIEWCDEEGSPSGSDQHFAVWYAILYSKPEDLGLTGYLVVDGDELRMLPELGAEVRAERDKIDAAAQMAKWEAAQHGHVYVVALVPDLDRRRLKIGWTGGAVEKRVDAFRTTSPTCELVAAWPAKRVQERLALTSIPGRLSTRNEVFQVDDVDAALAILDGLLGPRRSPCG